jgi:hypothetical protein
MKTLQEQIKDLEKQLAELKKMVGSEPEHQYPIYCLSKSNGAIVQFNNLQYGIVIKKGEGAKAFNEGETASCFVAHTYTDVWEVLPICPRTGFYHKQRVWFWDNDQTHVRYLGFYDAINSSTYNYNGNANSYSFQNYEAVTTPWEDWQIEAFKTLQ